MPAAADAESVAAACTGRHSLASARPRPSLLVPGVSTSEEVGWYISDGEGEEDMGAACREEGAELGRIGAVIMTG